MTKRIILALAIAAIATSTSLASSHQTSGTGPGSPPVTCGATWDATTQRGVLTVGQGAATTYYDFRAVNSNGYTYSLWIYLEFNGHAGMQTNRTQPSALEGTPDNCATSLVGHASVTTPDALLF